jgi:rhomboid protease GluP
MKTSMDKRRMCPHCRAFITSSDRVCPYCETAVGPRAVDRRNPAQYVGGFIPHAHFVTSMILLLNFGLFAASVIFSMRSGKGDFWDIDGATLFLLGAKSREGIILGGQWWRLVTAGFLHGGVIHLVMNSWVLFDVGAQVEEMYGSTRLVVFYFVATVAGFFASFWWSPNPSVGASAGLFGLIGAMIAFGMRDRSRSGEMIRGLYIRWAIYGLLLGVLPFFRIDNAAHIGGLAGGFAVAYVAGAPKLVPGWGERFWRAAAGAALALTALSFAALYNWFTYVTRQP